MSENDDEDPEQQRRWDALYAELKPGLEADESEFVELNVAEILAEARKRVGIKTE